MPLIPAPMMMIRGVSVVTSGMIEDSDR